MWSRKLSMHYFWTFLFLAKYVAKHFPRLKTKNRKDILDRQCLVKHQTWTVTRILPHILFQLCHSNDNSSRRYNAKSVSGGHYLPRPNNREFSQGTAAATGQSQAPSTSSDPWPFDTHNVQTIHQRWDLRQPIGDLSKDGVPNNNRV